MVPSSHAPTNYSPNARTSIPAGVTAPKLRHTFASMLIALGKDPACVMAQLGHADPKFTLRVYTHVMRRATRNAKPACKAG